MDYFRALDIYESLRLFYRTDTELVSSLLGGEFDYRGSKGRVIKTLGDEVKLGRIFDKKSRNIADSWRRAVVSHPNLFWKNIKNTVRKLEENDAKILFSTLNTYKGNAKLYVPETATPKDACAYLLFGLFMKTFCGPIDFLVPKEMKSAWSQDKPFYTQQLSRNLPLGQTEKRKISELLYKADPYIFPALFTDCDQAQRILPRLFLNDGGDTLFRLENIFAAFFKEELVGILLWHEGPLKWNGEALHKELLQKQEIISQGFQEVIDRYFYLYENRESNRIYIRFLQMSESFDTPDAEAQLLKDFIDAHPGKTMEMRVFDEKSAMELYTSQDFKQSAGYDGFHQDAQVEINAILLVREA